MISPRSFGSFTARLVRSRSSPAMFRNPAERWHRREIESRLPAGRRSDRPSTEGESLFPVPRASVICDCWQIHGSPCISMGLSKKDATHTTPTVEIDVLQDKHHHCAAKGSNTPPAKSRRPRGSKRARPTPIGNVDTRMSLQAPKHERRSATDWIFLHADVDVVSPCRRRPPIRANATQLK